jgi:hypothetical protein
MAIPITYEEGEIWAPEMISNASSGYQGGNILI